jgi:hypothetical protein
MSNFYNRVKGWKIHFFSYFGDWSRLTWWAQHSSTKLYAICNLRLTIWWSCQFSIMLECQFSILEHDIKHSLVVATGSVLDLFHANHSRNGIILWKSWEKQPVRLAGGWWLVLVCSERKVLLSGCWWLVCSERKVSLAGVW